MRVQQPIGAHARYQPTEAGAYAEDRNIRGLQLEATAYCRRDLPLSTPDTHTHTQQKEPFH
jgi:hypothetical protein